MVENSKNRNIIKLEPANVRNVNATANLVINSIIEILFTLIWNFHCYGNMETLFTAENRLTLFESLSLVQSYLFGWIGSGRHRSRKRVQ